MAMQDFSFDPFDTSAEGAFVQEEYNAASSRYSDLFGDKFNSFNPETIVSGGNNSLKSGQFDIDIEDSDLALGYKQPEPATSPKPGRFMQPD